MVRSRQKPKTSAKAAIRCFFVLFVRSLPPLLVFLPGLCLLLFCLLPATFSFPRLPRACPFSRGGVGWSRWSAFGGPSCVVCSSLFPRVVLVLGGLPPLRFVLFCVTIGSVVVVLSFPWWCPVSSPSLPSLPGSAFPSSLVVSFGGSRSLPASSVPLVRSVVSAAWAAGAVVSVGCAVGADQAVVSSALACAAGGVPLSVSPRLWVSAVGAPSGAGFWSGSAVASVRAAAAAGARVSWLAGGPVSVPLRARLLLRSRAALRGARCAVFFLASPSSAGSLAVAGCAVSSGVPVFAFCSSVPCPPRGCAGSWVSSAFLGFPCWSWVPAGGQLPLF